ncbi:MAG TPA: sugar ABC transporter substrate-binding protein [Lachnospiraceae bacterium]|nr:sugar ABC transporter substrate-binding protein [Lachnospiraceae bacterium]
MAFGLVGCGGSGSVASSEPAADAGSSADAEMSAAPSGSEGAGSAAASDGSGVQVGIVLPTKDEPRWIQDETRFGEILEQAGFTYQVLFSQGSSATEKANVETLVSNGVQVLILCPQDSAAAASTVDYAADNGATVISYDRLITGTDKLDYIVGFDSTSVGVAQGNYLIEQAGDTKGNPLYLYAGATTDENAFLFFEGAWQVLQPKIADGTFVIKNSSEAEALADTPELDRDQMSTILGQITTDWDFEVSKSKAEANLTAASAEDKGDVFILAPNDGTSRSIADVFAIDPDVTSYVITGQDAESASIQYIIDGKQSMTVLKDTRLLSQAAVDMATQILTDGQADTNAVYDNGAAEIPMYQMEVLSVTKDTMQEYIFDSEYYDAADFTGLE